MAEMEIKLLNKEVALSPARAVGEAEREYHARIESVANHVVEHGSIRTLLIAGPSGSGKTTTANLIADAIRRRGEDALVVSLDDFYRDSTDPDYPRLENGQRDIECPDSLHLDQVVECIDDVCHGRSFILPKYDFREGRRTSQTKHAPIPHGLVIIEGLHTLNPRISGDLDPDYALKMFISVSTNINDSGVRIISGRKIRFVRRLVRDSIYRGTSCERTLDLWRGVLAAEDKYLYPYKGLADIHLDTFHTFELGVMRGYAEELITPEIFASDSYAATVARALSRITPVPEDLVPQSSLIREFIPGGIYESLY